VVIAANDIGPASQLRLVESPAVDLLHKAAKVTALAAEYAGITCDVLYTAGLTKFRALCVKPQGYPGSVCRVKFRHRILRKAWVYSSRVSPYGVIR
jgi:hypothetical protein